MAPRQFFCALQLVASAALASSALADIPSFTPIGYVPGTQHYMAANRISSNGRTVVGAGNSIPAYWTRESGVQSIVGFGGFVDTGYAVAVSGDGLIITGYGTVGIQNKAFRAPRGQAMQSIPGLPANYNSRGEGVNGDGSVIVGWEGRPDGQYAFRWDATTGVQYLGSTPGPGYSFHADDVSADGAVVVGRHDTVVPSAGYAFRWTSQTGLVHMNDLAGGSILSVARAVSPDGSTAVGASEGGQAHQTAVRWDSAGNVFSLGQLPDEERNMAQGVSGDGSVIVGGAAVRGVGNVGFVWDSDHGMRTAVDFLTAHEVITAGWKLTTVSDVSADGLTFIGMGINPSGETQGWIATIPASGGLGIVLLASLFGIQRRRS